MTFVLRQAKLEDFQINEGEYSVTFSGRESDLSEADVQTLKRKDKPFEVSGYQVNPPEEVAKINAEIGATDKAGE